MLCKLRYSLTTLAAIALVAAYTSGSAQAQAKNRPNQAHVAISVGDGRSIESKKGRNAKVLGNQSKQGGQTNGSGHGTETMTYRYPDPKAGAVLRPSYMQNFRNPK